MLWVMRPLPSVHDAWQNIQPGLRSTVENHLESGETPVAWFEPDLDTRLNYSCGLVVLTDRRVLSVDSAEQLSTESTTPPDALRFQSWPLDSLATLRTREYASVGALDLAGPATQNGTVALHDRAILGGPPLRGSLHGPQAIAQGEAEELPDVSESICPSCGATLADDEYECPACAGTAASAGQVALPPAALRPPLRGMILLGFTLTLAGTAAGLVSPYLTMPLVNKVLIPAQTGKHVSFHLVAWYLFGLAAASLAAWVLGWGRTYVAGLGQRAGLRRPPQPHLRPPALALPGILRRQADRRPDRPRQHRHRPDLLFPLGLPAGLRHRHPDDPHDRRHPALDRSLAGRGHALPAAADRLAGLPRPRQARAAASSSAAACGAK